MLRCVSCSKKAFREYGMVSAHMLLLCVNCGLLSVNTTSTNRNIYINEQYGENYRKGFDDNLLKYYERYGRHLLLIERYLIEGKLLDVGCGIGHFLKYVKNTSKRWILFGIEPNSRLRKLANKTLNFSIKEGSLNKIPFDDTFFDVISCLDVLEHSAELQKNIHELKRVLKPKGLLLIQAPNYKSVMAYITGKRWDWWCVPDHVLHFSYHFLIRYLQANGFQIIKSYTYEDQEDYISNIKGIFSRNYITKLCFILLIPFFLIIERIGWMTNKGGLSIVLARKI